MRRTGSWLRRTAGVTAAAAVWVLATVACKQPEAGVSGEDPPAEMGALELLSVGSVSASAVPDSAPPGQGDAELLGAPPALSAVRTEAVVGRTGPGGEPFEVAVHSPDRPGHERIIGKESFQISLRGSPSTGDACGSCHRPGLPVIQAERIEDAHRYVLPRHPEESGTHCSTCHATDDVQSLVLASGERISLEHAYRLCAQCHYAQADDWAAGTHGKRLDGWRGRRVVMGCPDCHDPHQPAVGSRIPYPGPRLPTTAGHSP